MPRSAQRSSTRSTGASSRTRELAHDRAPRAAARPPRPRRAARARRRCAAPAARRARGSPRGPSQARWIIAASAFSACAVQMLWVAFSRRMCCSRVCRARTKPRRPSTSSVSPAIRPGMRRICSSVAQKKPNEGPPKSSRLPSGWPSPRAMSAPHSPGGLQDAERHRVAGDDEQRAVLLGRGAERLDVLDRAEEVGALQEDGGGLVVDRVRRARRRRSPRPSSPTSTTSAP